MTQNRDGQEELRQLALLADAISGLTHALNNHLNGVVLQAAALQLRVPEEFREGLERIRKEGSQAAHLFRPLQWVRQQARQQFQDLDLSELTKQAIKTHADGAWTASSGSLSIPGGEGSARRMFQYLFEALEEYRDPQTPGVVTFENDPAPVVQLEMKLKDPGMQEPLGRLGASQEQDLSLHFLAIRSLVRLLEGRLDVNFPEPTKAHIRLVW